MSTIMRKEWFGGIIGDTSDYNLKVINEYTFKYIIKVLKFANTDEMTKLSKLSGIKIDSNLKIFDNSSPENKSLHLLSAPIITWIEVSNQCPNKCKHCFKDFEEIYSFSQSKLISIIEDLSSMGVFKITLTGGEPLAYKGIEDIINYINMKGMSTRIFTGGCITKEQLMKIKKCSVDILFFSLDGGAKSNDSLRGIGSFEKVIRNIELAKTFPINNINEIVISYTMHKANFNELEDIYRICKEYKIKTILIRPLFIYKWFDKTCKELALSKEELFRYIKKFSRLSEKYRVEYQINKLPFIPAQKIHYYHDKKNNISLNALVNNNSIDCVGGNIVCGIKSNGKVIPCGFLNIEYSNEYNIYDTDFNEIWKFSPNLKVLRNLSSTGFCKSCKMLQLCSAGCRAICYAETNELGSTDPYCIFHDTSLGVKQLSLSDYYNKIELYNKRIYNDTMKLDQKCLFFSSYNIISKCGSNGTQI